LPEVGRGPLMVMTERLRDFERIDGRVLASSFSPEGLLDELLYGMPFTRLEESPIGFECWCDELRVVSAIATLSRSDIEHLLSDGQMLEIECEYCKREYRIAPARLRGLLNQSGHGAPPVAKVLPELCAPATFRGLNRAEFSLALGLLHRPGRTAVFQEKRPRCKRPEPRRSRKRQASARCSPMPWAWSVMSPNLPPSC